MSEDKELIKKMLAEAEAEKTDLEGVITYLRRKLGLNTKSSSSPTNTHIEQEEAIELRSDSFFGMQVAEAIKKYLSIVKRPKPVSEIIEALEKGGLTSSSKNLYTTVMPTLIRKAKRDIDFVKVSNGSWGLIEWYPGRKKNKINGNEDTTEKPPEEQV